MNKEQAKALREPFPKEAVGKLPKPYQKDSPKGNCRECGGYHGLPAVHLDYVGHAATTDRLLQVDPEWTWEPVAFDNRGLPGIDEKGGLWIRLTVAGVTRLGYGHASGKTGPDAIKEAIGDAIRNAAMRFGVALDLWAKEDILSTTSFHETTGAVQPEAIDSVSGAAPVPTPDVAAGAGEGPAATSGTARKKPDGWRIKLYQGLRERFPNDRDAGLRWVSLQIGRAVSSTDDLSSSEVQDVVAIMRGARPEVVEPPEYEPEDAA